MTTHDPAVFDGLKADQGLEVENIEVRYGKKVAVTNISLGVEPGKITAVIGPSGCGKSTTLKTVAGLNFVSAGKILLGGKDITDLSPDKRNIGLVPQSYAVFPHMSVAKNIGYGLRARKVDSARLEERVQEVLELVQLTEFADRMPDQLSGGQRQRVALGRAIAVDPEILLLDEPLAALDPQLRSDLRRQLAKIIEAAGMGTLIVTHDQHEAMALADHVAILKEGVMVQYGTPEELFERPVNTFVADFLTNSTLVDAKVEGDVVELFDGAWQVPVSAMSKQADARDPQVLIRKDSLEVVGAGQPGSVQGTFESVEYAGGKMLTVVNIDGTRIQSETEELVSAGDTAHFAIRPGKAVLIGGGA